MKLIIADKNYSSWSMRPWIAARTAGLEFQEILIFLREKETSSHIAQYGPHGKVPVLVDGDVVVFESIAILEYLAEKAPSLWPEAPDARALARSVSAEMHSGFTALRSRCSMNIRRVPEAIALSEAVMVDVGRIETLWRDCRTRFGGEGPFLFGRFSNADAMYAPVVSRFITYSVPVAADSRAYMEAVTSLPAWREWETGARAETHVIADIDVIA